MKQMPKSKVLVSIIIPSIGRESLYPLVDNLSKQKANFLYEIVVIAQKEINTKIFNKKIKMKYAERGKGFSYYRNLGVKTSKGAIIVFIDDDELPVNSTWLSLIVSPIIKNQNEVVTSGYKILLNQDYFTNSVSLLGFPGGGAVGFKTMWPVVGGYTKHICTGNFAITKKLLLSIGGFDDRLTYGNEDVLLANKLIQKGLKIRYIENATVYHLPRKGYLNFIRWNILRGKSNFQLQKLKKNVSHNLYNRIASSLLILKKFAFSKYMPGILFFMINQYFWQSMGYITETIEHQYKL